VGESSAECDLVQGLRDGSRDAWEALCEQYSSRVWRYVARLIGRDAEAVADVYQETMLAVARSGRSLSPDTRLWAWLVRIAHNQAALHWRKHYRTEGAPADVDRLSARSDGNPVELLATAERVEAVRRLLADMESDHAALLTAKYLDEMSVAQIVEQFGGTTEGVRSKLARARREFRTRYERLSVE